MKRNYGTARRARENEPSAERQIVGTDWVLQVFEGYDRKSHEPYYHYRFLRANSDGSRTFSTARPVHLIQQVTALAVACRGFSNLSGIDPSIREQLAIVAEQLANIPLPQLNERPQASKPPYANGAERAVGNAFGFND